MLFFLGAIIYAGDDRSHNDLLDRINEHRKIAELSMYLRLYFRNKNTLSMIGNRFTNPNTSQMLMPFFDTQHEM